MSKREKEAYRQGQKEMAGIIFGTLIIASMFAAMLGQAFLF